jgi:REP element-mobilizing transposase RayT
MSAQGNALGPGNDRSLFPEILMSPERAKQPNAFNMTQSLVKNLIHLVYSTKNRQGSIPKTVREPLFAYQAGILRELECPAIIIGGTDDHVHALFSLSKNHALKTIVEEVKKGSSKWMKTQGPQHADFLWQAGYAGFSVSQSNAEEVRRYIDDQENRHKNDISR